MASYSDKQERYYGPTLEDCEKLWTTINRELVSDAEIVIRLRVLPLGQDRPRVIICSPGLDPETGADRPHVWATCELSQIGVAFSYANLHSTLAMAYHNMEAHLSGQQMIWDDPTEK